MINQTNKFIEDVNEAKKELRRLSIAIEHYIYEIAYNTERGLKVDELESAKDNLSRQYNRRFDGIINKVMQGQQEQNVTKLSESLGKDEMYCDWYRCLNCNDDNRMNTDNFCANCGLKIIK